VPRPLISLGALLLTIWAAGCGGSSPSPSATPGSDEAAGLIGGRAVFYGGQLGDGAAAIIAGDFNGDGASDIVFGAPLADGPGDARPEGGEVYFFPGPFHAGDERDVARGEQRLTIYGANAGDQLGLALAAGDVNGDAVDDIVLGAPAGDDMPVGYHDPASSPDHTRAGPSPAIMDHHQAAPCSFENFRQRLGQIG